MVTTLKLPNNGEKMFCSGEFFYKSSNTCILCRRTLKLGKQYSWGQEEVLDFVCIMKVYEKLGYTLWKISFTFSELSNSFSEIIIAKFYFLLILPFSCLCELVVNACSMLQFHCFICPLITCLQKALV